MPDMNPMLLAICTLWQREIVRFYRQPSRVVGAFGSPLLFWLLIGSGIGRSFQGTAQGRTISYLEYFFPGTILMILLFTAIFSTISIIEDRREGFLQAALVAPVPRLSIAMGKLLGGASLATLQGVLFLMVVPFLGLPLSAFGVLRTLIVMFVSAFSLTGLGFIIAWKMHSIQGFHAIMNLFLMPLWLLSGALFPPEGAASWLKAVMRWNPLHYELDLIRSGIYGTKFSCLSVTVTLGFTLVMLVLVQCVMSKRDAKNLI